MYLDSKNHKNNQMTKVSTEMSMSSSTYPPSSVLFEILFPKKTKVLIQKFPLQRASLPLRPDVAKRDGRHSFTCFRKGALDSCLPLRCLKTSLNWDMKKAAYHCAKTLSKIIIMFVNVLVTKSHQLWWSASILFSFTISDFSELRVLRIACTASEQECCCSELGILLLSGGEALRLGGTVHTAKYRGKFQGHNLIMFSFTQWEIYSGNTTINHFHSNQFFAYLNAWPCYRKNFFVMKIFQLFLSIRMGTRPHQLSIPYFLFF